MSILQELIDYANSCINDEIISCIKHKWACERFLRDVARKNDDNWPYYWNEEEADKIVEWFTYLRHSKGILSGEPIRLTIWQKFNLCQIYGWRRKDNDRKRFRTSFIEVARKQAKSQMQAGVLLYEMAVQSTKNREIYETYCAGTKREQSKLIFNECVNMLRGSLLEPKFKMTKAEITHKKTGSFLKALNKEDGKKGDGTNPACLVIDEYHQHNTTEFYDLGIGSNSKEPILMIITTAGVDLTYPCYTQEYTYCSKLLNPQVDVENEEYFTDICEIDEGDDISDYRNWEKANPLRMSYKEGVEKILSDYEVAKEVPEKMITFRTKVLNQWVQAKDSGYMDMAKWKKCEVKEIPFDLTGKEVYIGFDMSSKIDLTSIAFVFPIMDDGTPKYVVKVHSFIPNREKLMERVFLDKVPYDAWAEQGYITITDTPIVDQNVVIEYFKEECKSNNWDVEKLCFDPQNASKLMMDLSHEGYECVEVYQSHRSLNESTQGFREQVYCENVIYEYNPLFNFSMSNAVIRQSNGNIKIDKDATKKKIDPIDATLGAFKLAMYHEFKLDLGNLYSEDYINKLLLGGNSGDS